MRVGGGGSGGKGASLSGSEGRLSDSSRRTAGPGLGVDGRWTTWSREGVRIPFCMCVCVGRVCVRECATDSGLNVCAPV